MDISQAISSSAMAIAIRNLQAIAEGQQQMAATLEAAGVGQNVSVYA